MQNNKITIILGIIVVIGVAVGLGYWVKDVFPNQAQINEGASEVKSVDRNILTNPTVKTIEERQKNGNLPIVISEGDLGKSNPFE